MSCDDLFIKAEGGQDKYTDIDPDGYKIGKFPIRVRCFKEMEIKWRSDERCGLRNPLKDGRPGQCDPNNEEAPCCSQHGWCGNSDVHCNCAGCYDFRSSMSGLYFYSDDIEHN